MFKKILKNRREVLEKHKQVKIKHNLSLDQDQKQIKSINQNPEILKMCSCCYSFKYNGGWHFEEPAYIKERDSEEEVPVSFTKCTSCIQELLSQYEMEFA